MVARMMDGAAGTSIAVRAPLAGGHRGLACVGGGGVTEGEAGVAKDEEVEIAVEGVDEADLTGGHNSSDNSCAQLCELLSKSYLDNS